MTSLAYLTFEHAAYRIADRAILQDLSFDLERGETLVLLGRSGSGKTTALRLINRLIELTSGAILLDEKNIQDYDPIALRRSIGYVIQEVGLLPHWSVERNVALVPHIAKIDGNATRSRVAQLLEEVGLPSGDYAHRYPRQLSGGQRQRVGVARALAAEPRLLLFDEPFGALDPVTRHEMQQQFLALRSQYQLASVFVTHDISEALMLGSKIGLLDDGVLKVLATPECFRRSDEPLARAFLNTLLPATS